MKNSKSREGRNKAISNTYQSSMKDEVVNNIVKQYEVYLSQTQNLDEIWTTKLELKLGLSVITWQVNR